MRAPMAMKLSNNVIMKRRRDKNRPVPIFLKSNTLDSYGERMLFQPWRSVDELLGRQSEEDKEKQKQIRLELFPMAMFPESHGGVGRRREDLESSVTGPDEAS